MNFFTFFTRPYDVLYILYNKLRSRAVVFHFESAESQKGHGIAVELMGLICLFRDLHHLNKEKVISIIYYPPFGIHLGIHYLIFIK